MDFELWNSEFEFRTLDFGLRTLNFGLQTLDLGLQALGFGLWSAQLPVGTPCFVILLEYQSGHNSRPLVNLLWPFQNQGIPHGLELQLRFLCHAIFLSTKVVYTFTVKGSFLLLYLLTKFSFKSKTCVSI